MIRTATAVLGLLLTGMAAPETGAAQRPGAGSSSLLAQLQAVQSDAAALRERLRQAGGAPAARCCTDALARVTASVTATGEQSRLLIARLAAQGHPGAAARQREVAAGAAAMQAALDALRSARDGAAAGEAATRLIGASERHAVVARRYAAADPLLWYRQMVLERNDCTTLVRRVCGENFQCAASSGCPVALKLLGMYNNRPDPREKQDALDSCMASLGDEAVFPMCTVP